MQVLKEYVEKVDVLASDHTERKTAAEAVPAVPNMHVTQLMLTGPMGMAPMGGMRPGMPPGGAMPPMPGQGGFASW